MSGFRIPFGHFEVSDILDISEFRPFRSFGHFEVSAISEFRTFRSFRHFGVLDISKFQTFWTFRSFKDFGFWLMSMLKIQNFVHHPKTHCETLMFWLELILYIMS